MTVIIIGVCALILILIIAAIIISAVRKKKTPAEKQSTLEIERRFTHNPLINAVSSRNINYEPIIEIARIFTDNNSETVNKMRLLARNYPEFVTQHQHWCESVANKINGDKNDKDLLVANFFAHWLSGFLFNMSSDTTPTGIFGCYISGDEKPRQIIDKFEAIDRTLNYGFDLKSLSLSGLDNTTKLLDAVNSTLLYKRYSLFSFETTGIESQRFAENTSHKGFYLFIAPISDNGKISNAAHNVDFKIYRQIAI